MANRSQKRTTTFVTAPIAFLAVAAFAVVLASLIVAARETDSLALAHQRATIENALNEHGHALGRELRVQTVWNEAYEKTLARDRAWMRAFYGQYLSDLFGYDWIGVLSAQNEPIYGFANGRDEAPAKLAQIVSGLTDLVTAVRNPNAVSADYHIVTTPIALGNGETLEHRAVADVRNIDGTPATVVVSTIVPDRPPQTPMGQPPFLLVAIEDLDRSFTKELGANFGFRNLEWIKGEASLGRATEPVKALDGVEVGTLAWRRSEPGWDFARHVAIGLALALLLLAALAGLLMRWGRRQAQQLLTSEEEAREAARTDALTGLPNRAALVEVLPQLIEQAGRSGSTLGMLVVDIDQFKHINDDFGHAMGDAVLLALAARLRGLLQPGAVLARLDGDEFMVLVPGIDAAGLGALSRRLVSALAEPVDVPGRARVFITASVGYALAPRDGDSDDDLVRRVELALAKAKEDGGGTAVAFAPEMDLELSHRRAVESALRTAIATGAIDVVYQPIMDPTGAHVLGVEALARWTDPLLGPVAPDVFVPIAEENGLIPRIGELVLRRAVDDGFSWTEVDVAVNVSGAQVHHGDVVSLVRDILRDSGFPPQRLVIEITETVLLVDEKRADEQIRGLQRMGVKVALDDFGSGYSSLLYLRKFSFDKLKFDRSFIEEIGRSKDSTLILASIIRLGLDLRLVITAEGIETPEQHRWLEACGCHQLQGYLFSRPLTAEQMTAFLAAHRRAAAG